MAFGNGAFGGTQGSFDRFMPAPPDVVFAALTEAARIEFKKVRPDEFMKSLECRSRRSALTWGEHYSAQVLPAHGGSTIRVFAASRVNGAFETTGRMHKMVETLFRLTADRLRPS